MDRTTAGGDNAYDSLGQVVSGKKRWSDGTLIPGCQFEYTFDHIGNRQQTQCGGDAQGGNLRTASYTGDSALLNQIASRHVPGQADILGIAHASAAVTINGQTNYRRGEFFQKTMSWNNTNASTFSTVEVVASLNGNNQTNTGKYFLPKTPEAFAYDGDGNLTNDGRFQYVWDAENRLKRVVSRADTPNASWVAVDFRYDQLGRRISKVVSNYTTGSWAKVLAQKYVYDGWNLIAELNATNNVLVRTYTWGADLSGTEHGAGGVGGLLVVDDHQSGAAVPYLCSYDGNGNVVGLLKASTGTSEAQYEYGPFGEVIRATGPMAKVNPFRFSTKYQDETDLLYYGYRYYNASTGRWLSRDLIKENGGINLYAYVENDPLEAIDPVGNKRFTIWAAAFIAPQEIRFPYAFASPWPGFDPIARWHGDNRGFGVVRGSSRAWNYVVIETDPAKKPERINVSGAGQTTVTYLVRARVGPIPIIFPFTEHSLAPDPARARITRPNPCVTIVSIDVASSNPLVQVSPPIRYSYTMYFDESRRKINYFGQHTQYPWHELWISGYGNVVADAPTNPTGTIPTPADLFLWQVPIKSDELSY